MQIGNNGSNDKDNASKTKDKKKQTPKRTRKESAPKQRGKNTSLATKTSKTKKCSHKNQPDDDSGEFDPPEQYTFNSLIQSKKNNAAIGWSNWSDNYKCVAMSFTATRMCRQIGSLRAPANRKGQKVGRSAQASSRGRVWALSACTRVQVGTGSSSPSTAKGVNVRRFEILVTST